MMAMVLLAASAIAGAGEPNPLRNAYFGDLHVHTSWSPDAFTQAVRTTPEDAYRFARGEAIDHVSGKKIRLNGGPLDFYAVTDHAEYMGILPGMLDPANPLSRHKIARDMASKNPNVRLQATIAVVSSITEGKPIPEFVNEAVTRSVWERIIEIAEKYNEPGKFTTFIAYEWTSNGPDGIQNLHRNIIFRNDRAADMPFSNFDSNRPEDLWNWMDEQRGLGLELLAIPHNGNLSDGLMFPVIDSAGDPIDAAWAGQRMRNEPIVEITQIKGTSETHPMLSNTDEFAEFEISDFLIAGEESGGRRGRPRGSYVRDAYRKGLVFEEALGTNPYQFGVIGSSDTHNAGAPVEEDNYFGKIGLEDGTPEARLLGKTQLAEMVRSWGAAGLAGVWAEENTREAIFDAMKRRETFGTSGPRLRVRFFGGWNFSAADAGNREFVSIGYDRGVPMGADLPERPPGAAAPTFLVSAMKDPNGANLDRIQIVKGWSKRGISFEQVYEVALSDGRRPDPVTGRLPPVGNTVRVANATYANSIGDPEMSAYWTDPGFDPTQRAFYYARVIEIPTPRWSTYDAVKLGVAAPDPETIQERAWSSPIWYTPGRADQEKGRKGVPTVASLEAGSARPLSTQEIRDLIVDKTVRIWNLVTGDQFIAYYGKDGTRVVARQVGLASLHGGLRSSKNRYEIRDGRLESSLDDGSRFSSRIYKDGNRYLGAKSDEAGYVNWQLAVTEY
jgi:hypothetical protein